MSAVVTTLIIILLAIVAIVIVWVVVKNVISKGSDDISLTSLNLNLEMNKVFVEDDTLNVVVKRKSGEGNLVGINFVISDGENSEVVRRETNMLELDTETFAFDLIQLNVGEITSISVVPVYEAASGKEVIGGPLDVVTSNRGNLGTGGGVEFEFPSGLISWWRFEGGTQDEIGVNHGNIYGDVQFVDGMHGQGASFDGVNDYVETGVTAGEFPTGSFTIMAWVNSVSNSLHMTFVGVDGVNAGSSALFYLQRDHPGHGDGWYFIVVDVGDSEYGDKFGGGVNNSQWYHIAAVYDNSSKEVEIFVDGVGTGSPATFPQVRDIADSNMLIGAGYYGGSITDDYQGIIDEVMLFDRALTDEEVESLYNLEP